MKSKAITRTELIGCISQIKVLTKIDPEQSETITTSIAMVHFGNELNYSGDFTDLNVCIELSKKWN